MNTLIVYDNNGIIFTQITGNYVKPVGIQHIEVEIPEGKYLTGVDVSGEVHEAIFEEYPQSEMARLSEKIIQQEEAIFELANMLSEVLG